MNKITLKRTWALVAPLVLAGTLHAQVSFKRSERVQAENKDVTLEGQEEARNYDVWPALNGAGFPAIGFYRGCPIVGDFNNDGRPDYYVSGQIGGTQKLVEPYNFVIGGWRCTAAVYRSTAAGYEAAFGGYDSFAANDNTFTAYGLPFTTNAYGRFIDLDNDGNLDFVVCSGHDYDTNWPYAEEDRDRDGKFFHVYRNLGPEKDYQFERVYGLPFAQSPNDGRDDEGWEVNNSISFGDYNNDGLVDVIYQGMEKTRDENGNDVDRRFVNLYKNLGNFQFELANVADPIPFERNYNTQAGIFDIEIDESDPLADPVGTPNYRFRPLSNSGIQFGDLNNDGYLDIVYTGWEDGVGASFAMYKNMGNGRFQELEILEDKGLGCFVGLQDKGDLVLADMNNDGLLDIVATGQGNGSGDKRCDIYYNIGDFQFERVSYMDDPEHNIHGVSNNYMQIADFNNDGLNDVIIRGHGFHAAPEGDNMNWDWHAWVYTQEEGGSFLCEQDNPNGICQDALNGGGIAICDWNGDGKLDVVSTNGNDNSRSDFYLSDDENEATVPSVPQNVKTVVNEDGQLVVTWDASSDASCEDAGLIYNLYVKNNATGAVSMLVPADVATGKLKVYTDVQVCARAAEGEALTHTFNLPKGTYTVGVSAINPALNASAFATSDIAVGVRNVSAAAIQLTVTATPNGILVSGDSNEPVVVYNATGKQIATGACNSEIAVSAKGICVVKCGGRVAKIIK